MHTIQTAEMDSPVGPLLVGARSGTVCLVAFADHGDSALGAIERQIGAVTTENHPDPGGGVTVLENYFDGDLGAVDSLSVDLIGTDFQRSVWEALRTIPAGTTTSYRSVAESIGSPGAVRAVGSANGANPIVVIVPCHRVVRSDGAIGGYGGGLDAKKWLLAHEAPLVRSPSPPR